jgi:hypothetical protein
LLIRGVDDAVVVVAVVDDVVVVVAVVGGVAKGAIRLR